MHNSVIFHLMVNRNSNFLLCHPETRRLGGIRLNISKKERQQERRSFNVERSLYLDSCASGGGVVQVTVRSRRAVAVILQREGESCLSSAASQDRRRRRGGVLVPAKLKAGATGSEETDLLQVKGSWCLSANKVSRRRRHADTKQTPSRMTVSGFSRTPWQAAFRRSERVFIPDVCTSSVRIHYLLRTSNNQRNGLEIKGCLPLWEKDRHLISASCQNWIGNLIGQGSLGTKLLIDGGDYSQ